MLPAHTGDPVAFDERAVSARLEEVERWLSGWLISESALVPQPVVFLGLAIAVIAEDTKNAKLYFQKHSLRTLRSTA